MSDARVASPDPTHDEPGEQTLAGLWSSALQALAGRAAHEINNALNGAIMNVEVVRARARPGADGGAAAQFANVAAEQLEESATLVGALLSLARAPRGTADVAEIARDALRLLVAEPAAGDRSAPTDADPVAARLATVAALVAVADCAARPEPKAESAGTESAKDPARPLRCTIRSADRPVIEIAPRYGAALAPAVELALARAGVTVAYDVGRMTLAFPPAATP